MTPEGRARLPQAESGLQVNGCKNPACTHFGACPDPTSEAKPSPFLSVGKTGFYDGNYVIRPAGPKGRPVLECTGCTETSPLKSNRAIVAERTRLEPLATPPASGCPKADCTNAEASPDLHPERYRRYGTRGQRQRFQCGDCGSVFTPGAWRGAPRQPWLFEEYQAVERLLQHSPMRRILQGTGLNTSRLYRLMRRSGQAIRDWMQAGDQRAGQAASTRPLTLCVDRQMYTVNWSDRSDRRKVMLHAIATADQRSGYVFAMDVNYDPAVDPAGLAAQAAANGDAGRPLPYRQGDAARCWLPEERNRRMEGGVDVGATTGATAERRYRRTSSRADVETPEVAGRAPAKGALVREDVSVYAHFLRVRERLGDPPQVSLCFEQESAMRAACLFAWEDRVRAEACEAYYIRIAKGHTVSEKQAIGAATQERLNALQASRGCDEAEARRILVRHALNATPMQTRGPWEDRWLRHPCPTPFEPDKEVCRLTRRDPSEREVDNPKAVNGYAFATLISVDRFFLGVRYALNPLDRSRISGRSGKRSVQEVREDKWDVYHPYNPAHVQVLLDLQRLWWNWCMPDTKDGYTPAMRLGLAKAPLTLAQVLEAVGEDLGPVHEVQALQARHRQQRGSTPASGRKPPVPKPPTDGRQLLADMQGLADGLEDLPVPPSVPLEAPSAEEPVGGSPGPKF